MARDLALFQTFFIFFLFLEFFFLLPSEKYNGSRYSKCMWTKILKCGWSHFKKPVLAIFIGGLLFGAGTALSLLYFTQVGNVPYLVGPILLSVGLMFLVTGLVWVPVIKQKMSIDVSPVVFFVVLFPANPYKLKWLLIIRGQNEFSTN
uniref:Uncharacterized protein n=1 Tax=Sinocyclocheilus anshuiensis TaxID=1608454 RepID=A0A671MNB9_9TELE